MAFQIEAGTPSKVWLDGLSDVEKLQLEGSLSYTDESILFQASRFRKTGGWYKNKYGQAAFDAKIKEIKASAKKTLLFEEDGRLWTYSGLRQTIERLTGRSVENSVDYPSGKPFPYVVEPHALRYYQEEMVEALLKERHASVSVATGLGKSRALMEIVARLGLKTVIMTPSTSISEQLYDDFSKSFGKDMVGRFYDGYKEHGAQIVIGNAQSLTRIEEGSKVWCSLLKATLFISDESHLTAAETLASVCFGVMRKAPWRFFFSATQMRNDGLGPLLEGIIGPIVYDMPLSEGVEQGFLSRPVFHMVKVPSSFVPHKSMDASEVTRECLYYNDNVVRVVAKYANLAYKAKMPCVVLIEEVEQFTKLLPYLKVQPVFAHAALKDNKNKVPREYWESDPNKLVDEFNALRAPLLVGTSCISTGTDIRPVKFLIYWQGKCSEIKVKQAVGRGTRLYPNKEKCNVIDFDVYNVEVLHRHAEVRRGIYEDLLGPVVDIVPGPS